MLVRGTGLHTAGQVEGVEVEMRMRDIKTVSQAVLVPDLSASVEQPHILYTNQITQHEQLSQ